MGKGQDQQTLKKPYNHLQFTTNTENNIPNVPKGLTTKHNQALTIMYVSIILVQTLLLPRINESKSTHKMTSNLVFNSLSKLLPDIHQL